MTAIHVFGSYVTGEDELGDIDFVPVLAERDPTENLSKKPERRFHETGANPSTIVARLFFPQNEVRRELRKVSPALSLHDMDNIDHFGVAYLTIYVFDQATRRSIPPPTTLFRGRGAAEAQAPEAPTRLSDSRACLDPQAPPGEGDDAAIEEAVDLWNDGQRDDRTWGVLLRFQHMWANGASAAEIRDHLELSWSEPLIRAVVDEMSIARETLADED